MPLLLLALCVLSLSACALPDEFTLITPELAGTTASPGSRGPYASALITRSVRARVDDSLTVDLIVPFKDFAPLPGPHPVAIIIQGGLVPPERYHWLGHHLATRGWVTLFPHHRSDLAIFETGNALHTLDALRTLASDPGDELHGMLSSQPAALIGHSLGAVVAGKTWLADPHAFGPLIMLAGIPAQNDDFASRPEHASSRILSISGTRDGSLEPERAFDGFSILETSTSPSLFALVDGMTHYQWTTGITQDELEKEQTAGVTKAAAHQRALFLIDAHLEGRFDLLDVPARWPIGLLTHDQWLAQESP